VLDVLDAEIATGLFDQSRDRGVVDVTDPWKQVVLDLKDTTVADAAAAAGVSSSPGDTARRTARGVAT
jgi:hypothetical protein